MQSRAIDRLQVVSLKIILGDECPRKEDGHFDYQKALTLCQLNSPFSRRENRATSFGKKSVKHKTMKKIFPLNSAIFDDPHDVRRRELYCVNHARSAAYQNSAVPATQRRLNQIYSYSPTI